MQRFGLKVYMTAYMKRETWFFSAVIYTCTLCVERHVCPGFLFITNQYWEHLKILLIYQCSVAKFDYETTLVLRINEFFCKTYDIVYILSFLIERQSKYSNTYIFNLTLKRLFKRIFAEALPMVLCKIIFIFILVIFNLEKD